ncbi:MAG: two component transcriptional regulator, winged helix family [Anaerolineales bacterium]|nr:two component transcriptional regulator, winged helix family [Anaerolineales bacterium]MBM2843598.1 two component transcriptional regulator, winged helix family [Anaerolineales bacterium]
MAKTILVVDDEARLVALLEAYLKQEGFRVVSAENGRQAAEVARREKPDLIVLDIMMPEVDGLQFLREHRRRADTPVILLTARVEDEDRIVGLELGADDYLTKPFRPRELLARIRAVLRRSDGSVPPASSLQHRELRLDRERHQVTLAGREVDLTPSEFELLAALMSRPGRVFSRLELLERMQGIGYEGYERAIDVHVKNLRAKIEPDSRHPEYVQTVYGVGYRLAEGL